MTEQCVTNISGHECSCGCGAHMSMHSEEGCGCGCNCSEKFLKLADEAWMEVLKEKIKSKIMNYKGEHMEQLAEIIAKANGERWKNKISSKMKGHEFKESLKEFFSSCE